MSVLFPIRMVPSYTASTPVRSADGLLLDWYASASYRSDRSSAKYPCRLRHHTILVLISSLKFPRQVF